MLLHCNDLDFLGLAQRQQEKFSGFSYAKTWDCERGTWVRKKTALFEFGEEGDGKPCVWIGRLSECQAVFEFDDEEFEDDPPAENKVVEELVPKFRRNLFSSQGLTLVKALSEHLFIGGVIASVTLFIYCICSL